MPNRTSRHTAFAAVKKRRKATHQGLPTTMDSEELRARVATALEQISARMVRRLSAVSPLDTGEPIDDPAVRTLQARVAELGQLAAGLAMTDVSWLPASGAGFGSRVRVQKLHSGEIAEYMLMVGSLVDLDANQVSLASPIGQALIGRDAGELVSFLTPQGPVQLMVLEVKTILDVIADADLHEPAVAVGQG